MYINGSIAFIMKVAQIILKIIWANTVLPFLWFGGTGYDDEEDDDAHLIKVLYLSQVGICMLTS